jgi:hypothetical protein
MKVKRCSTTYALDLKVVLVVDHRPHSQHLKCGLDTELAEVSCLAEVHLAAAVLLGHHLHV